MISFYNGELDRFNSSNPGSDRKERDAAVDKFIDTNPTKISWSAAFKVDFAKNNRLDFDDTALTQSLYRPFTRQWLYYSRAVNERVYQMPRIFPMAVAEDGNRVIMVKQRQHDGSQFALMTDHIPELQTDGGTQCL